MFRTHPQSLLADHRWKILEEGKAFELAGNRWHLNCFRCNTCNTLLDSDANLLLLGDGSLICNNCTYSCHSCHNKIEDLAILTGDQAYCASCFRCRNCKRKIENLRYARTSQGIFCMSCHESLMARRRKKTKAAASSRATKEKEVMLVDKSLPALPPNVVPQSAFSPQAETPGSVIDTPTELSPRPHAGPLNDSSSISSRRARSPERSVSESTTREALTLPNAIYRGSRHSEATQASDADGGDGESFFIPLALDPSPAPMITPRQDTRGDFTQQAESSERDYFTSKRNTGRQVVREQESNTQLQTQTATPHIAFQEKGRRASSDYTDSPKDSPKKTQQNSSLIGVYDDSKNKIKPSGSQSSVDRFRLQEAPKSKKPSMSRSPSESDTNKSGIENNTAKQSGTVPRKELPQSTGLADPAKSLLVADRNPGRTSQDSRPSIDSSNSRIENRTITRKEISSSNKSASGQDTSSSASSGDTPGVTPTVNGKSISGPLLQSPMEDLSLPNRAAGRPAPPQQKLSDSFMAPRAAPPAPPISNHRPGKASVGSANEPVSPKLPRWSSGGDFTMEEDMARILGNTDEGSKSIMRRVSNAVRHGRTNSEQSNSGRHGHGRSISETTRGTASPRWPKTPIAEDPNGDSARHISSPISISSPLPDDPALLRRQLRNSEQKVAELEREIHNSADLKTLNKKLIEKRKTVSVLDTQAELMIRQIETLAETVEIAKESDQFDFKQAQDRSLDEFKRKIEKLKDSVSFQIEELIVERDALEEAKSKLIKDRDRALVEFEQLVSKNTQLADLNNDLTHSIQEKFKTHSNSTNPSESPRPPHNGLGIYTHHSKAKSSTSIGLDDASLRPSTGTTLQGSSIGNMSTYPQAMDQEAPMEPATVLSAPHVVNIRKVQGKKFNWKGNVAKAAAKGFKGAFSSQPERGQTQWGGQTGDSIGMPYDTTMAPMELSNAGSVPRSGSSDPSRQVGGFGLFKKQATMPKAVSNGSLTPIVAEPPTKLFGSFLVERADYERAQIPSIVTRCIEEVFLRGMDVEGIYRKSGGASQVKAIQDGFERSTDYDISDPELDIIAISSALKQYFRKLPIPLLTYDVYDRVLASKDIEDDEERCEHLRDTFEQLPPKHRSCLEYLVFHLVQVAQKRELNKVSRFLKLFKGTLTHNLSRCIPKI